MSEETPCTNEPSLETKAIETWIQNDVKVNYTPGADIATGNQDYVSDATDSPKRGDSAFFNVDSETDEHDHANVKAFQISKTVVLGFDSSNE